MVYAGRNRNVNTILQHYAVMWGLTLIGVLFGTWLPSSIVNPLSLVCFVLIVVSCFIKHIKLPDPILYIIPFLTGIMYFWIYLFLVDFLGEDLLITVFISTAIIFILLTVAGLKIPGNVTETMSIIFTALVVIFVFSVVFIFFPVENTFLLFLAAMFVLLTAIYTVYEFTIICSNYVRDVEVIGVAIYLYLSFFNLLANIIAVVRR